jgi:hypothetical protein
VRSCLDLNDFPHESLHEGVGLLDEGAYNHDPGALPVMLAPRFGVTLPQARGRVIGETVGSYP